MKRKILNSVVLAGVVALSGCVTAPSGGDPASADVTAQGNAVYDFKCPVLLPNGDVATFVDEAGDVQPVMAEYNATSGRSSAGGEVSIDIENCISVEIEGGLVQGERRPSTIENLGNALFGIIGLLLGSRL